MEAVLTILLEKGGLSGALLVAVLFALYRLYLDSQREREAHRLVVVTMQAALNSEHEKRLEDARRTTEALLAQNEKVHSALQDVTQILEALPSQPLPRMTTGRMSRP